MVLEMCKSRQNAKKHTEYKIIMRSLMLYLKSEQFAEKGV
jgi:hypothetical protein